MNIEYIKKLIKQITLIGDKLGFHDHSGDGEEEIDTDEEVGTVIEIETEDCRPQYLRDYELAWDNLLNYFKGYEISINDIKENDIFYLKDYDYGIGVVDVYNSLQRLMSYKLENILNKIKNHEREIDPNRKLASLYDRTKKICVKDIILKICSRDIDGVFFKLKINPSCIKFGDYINILSAMEEFTKEDFLFIQNMKIYRNNRVHPTNTTADFEVFVKIFIETGKIFLKYGKQYRFIVEEDGKEKVIEREPPYR